MKLQITKPPKLYRIKHPNGQYKKVYEYKQMQSTGAYLVVSEKDFVCTEEDKNKIILLKGCTWELITPENNTNEVKKV